MKYVILIVFLGFIFMGRICAYIEYSIGDEVTYNGISFYVVSDSDSKSDKVTLLKAEPIKSSEIKVYIESTEISNKIDILGTYVNVPFYGRDTCVSAWMFK